MFLTEDDLMPVIILVCAIYVSFDMFADMVVNVARKMLLLWCRRGTYAAKIIHLFNGSLLFLAFVWQKQNVFYIEEWNILFSVSEESRTLLETS